MITNKYFRIFLLLVTALCNAGRGMAQNYPADPNFVIQGSANLIPLPAASSTPSLYNYTRTFVPRIPLTNSTNITLNGTFDYDVATDYLNGWGQSLQTNIRGWTWGNTDIITPHDLSPSMTKAVFLPYNATAKSKFYANRFQEQRNFYNNLYPAEEGASYSLSKTDFTNGTTITKNYQKKQGTICILLYVLVTFSIFVLLASWYKH